MLQSSHILISFAIISTNLIEKFSDLFLLNFSYKIIFFILIFLEIHLQFSVIQSTSNIIAKISLIILQDVPFYLIM